MRRTSRTNRLATPARAELQLEGLEARDVPASFVSFTGATYSQNFDNLGTSTVTNLISPGVQYLDEAPVSVSSLNGWSIHRLGGTTGSGPYPLTVGTGSVNAGGAYNFATAVAPSDRSLGTLLSGAFAANFGIVLRNNSASPITQLDVTYNSEQYRRGGGSGTEDRLDFQYQLGVADISPTTGWINLGVLNATSVNVSNSAVSSIDGNAAGRLARSATIDFSPGSWGVG
ncbi:MAG TPA: hypothetical protein VD866_08295, partial [Urbifossiella sp.]|nr:hypothetical protein [Urbifossiella sp.]